MKIIAVNISKQYKNETLLNATRRAWILDINKCKDFDYVIGVVIGDIFSYFRKVNVMPDREIRRVCFDLEKCSNDEELEIRNYISSHNIKLRGFVTKYI